MRLRVSPIAQATYLMNVYLIVNVRVSFWLTPLHRRFLVKKRNTKFQIFQKNFLEIKKARLSTGSWTHISDAYIKMGKKRDLRLFIVIGLCMSNLGTYINQRGFAHFRTLQWRENGANWRVFWRISNLHLAVDRYIWFNCGLLRFTLV